jgi:hypothetical protein
MSLISIETLGCGFYESVDRISRGILEVYLLIFTFCHSGYLKKTMNVIKLSQLEWCCH